MDTITLIIKQEKTTVVSDNRRLALLMSKLTNIANLFITLIQQ